MDWPLTADGLYAQAEAKLLLPLDASGTAIVQIKPDADAVAHGFVAVETGPPGAPPTFTDPPSVFRPLAPDDETPDYCNLTTVTPPTDTTAGVYQWSVGLHTGQDGADGDTVLTPTDYAETPKVGQMVVVDGSTDNFELQSQPFRGQHLPVHVYNAGSGNSRFTIVIFSVAANTYDRDWRPEFSGQTIVTGTGSNVLVNLVARLNDENGGNIVGMGFGLGGSRDRLVLSDGPPAGSPDSWNVVPANAAATIYIRTEQQEGSDSYSTSVDTTWFSMKAVSVP